MAIDLRDSQLPENDLVDKLENDIQPVEKAQVEEDTKVPFHQDPQVQLYIERQVAKRIGEGSRTYEERLNKLEERLAQAGQKDQPINIAGWTPGNSAEAVAAKAIIAQAKQEMLDEMNNAEQETQQAQQKDDRLFADWLGELRVTGVLNNDSDEKEFARLIVEYKLEDQSAAINLWKRLQTQIAEAKQEGEVQGIKKTQEAKIGSARKGSEPGSSKRSYQQRKIEEPNFSAILDREMNRLGY